MSENKYAELLLQDAESVATMAAEIDNLRAEIERLEVENNRLNETLIQSTPHAYMHHLRDKIEQMEAEVERWREWWDGRPPDEVYAPEEAIDRWFNNSPGATDDE